MNPQIVLLQQIQQRFFEKHIPVHSTIRETFDDRLKKEIILNFITNVRETYPKSSIMFTRGGCYKFHQLLYSIIGQSAIPYSTNDNETIDHVVTKIGEFYYDINGLWIEKVYFEPMDEKAIQIASGFFDNFNSSLLNS